MLKLFGRHIGRSTGNAGRLDGHRVGLGERPFIQRSKKLGQSEVEDLQHMLGRDAEIAGLKVAMKDAARVSGGQPAGQLHSERDDFILRERALVQTVVERGAGNILQHQVVEAVLGMEVVHRLNVGVIEAAESQGLATKLGPRRNVEQGLGVQHLDRNISLQALVPRAIHDPHATGADLDDESEVAENLPRLWRRRAHAANRMRFPACGQ